VNGSRAILIAALVGLLSGASLGLMGGILFSRSMLPQPPRHEERRMRRGGGDRDLLGHLERRLHLDAGQRDRIDDLLDQARRDMAASRESLHVRIGRELTPDQLREWNEMEKQRFNPGRNRRGQFGPPRPGEESKPRGEESKPRGEEPHPEGGEQR
jgi:hypothetical protein